MWKPIQSAWFRLSFCFDLFTTFKRFSTVIYGVWSSILGCLEAAAWLGPTCVLLPAVKHPDVYGKGHPYPSYPSYIMMSNMSSDSYMNTCSLSPPMPRTVSTALYSKQDARTHTLARNSSRSLLSVTGQTKWTVNIRSQTYKVEFSFVDLNKKNH